MQTTTTAALALLLSLGCGVVRGNGVPSQTERSVDGFEQVRSELSVPVEVLAGAPEGPVQVRCDENLQVEILERIVGDSLVLSHPEGRSLDPQTDCVVTVPAPRLAVAELRGSGDLDVEGDTDVLERLALEGSGDLRSSARASGASVDIDLRGSGDLSVDQLDAMNLDVRLEGSGNIAVRGGSAAATRVDLLGSGNADVGDVHSGSAEVTLEGSGNVTVQTSGSIRVRLTGSGNVVVHGSPGERDDLVTGSGTVAYR